MELDSLEQPHPQQQQQPAFLVADDTPAAELLTQTLASIRGLSDTKRAELRQTIGATLEEMLILTVDALRATELQELTAQKVPHHLAKVLRTAAKARQS